MKLSKINKCMYNNLIYLYEFIDKEFICSELYFYLIFGLFYFFNIYLKKKIKC